MTKIFTDIEVLRNSLDVIDPNRVGIIDGAGALALQARKPIEGQGFSFASLDILVSPRDIYQLGYFAGKSTIFDITPEEENTELIGFFAVPQKGHSVKHVRTCVNSGPLFTFPGTSYEELNDPEKYLEIREQDVITRVVKGEIILRNKMQSELRSRNLAVIQRTLDLTRVAFNTGVIDYRQYQELAHLHTDTEVRQPGSTTAGRSS